MLNLSPWEFAQGANGWVSVPPKDAPKVIREYLALWANGPEWFREVPFDEHHRMVSTSHVHWQLGILLGYQGPNLEAIDAISNAIVLSPPPMFRAKGARAVDLLQDAAKMRMTFPSEEARVAVLKNWFRL